MLRLLLPGAAFFAALLCSPASSAQTPAGPRAQEIDSPRPKVQGVEVTFLANEGFLIRSGRYSVLIDSFLREASGPHAALPEEVYKNLVNARAPFDELTIVLVSHGHPDHVQLRGLEKYLTNNKRAQLLSSQQVTRSLHEEARDFASIQRQVSPVPVVRGAGNKVVHEEMSIEFIELEHIGKANKDVLNLGHLLEMGGLKLLHVGDADPTLENFQPYHLAKRGIDVAFVPYWFFGSPEGARVLREEIGARVLVACHVPPSEWDKVNDLLKSQYPEALLFKDPLERRSFQPAGPPPTAEKDG